MHQNNKEYFSERVQLLIIRLRDTNSWFIAFNFYFNTSKRLMSIIQGPDYLPCVPSQYGLLLVPLHIHK